MTGPSFNAYGVTLQTPNGQVNLMAGPNITIWPQGDAVVVSAQIPLDVSSLNGIRNAIELDAGPGITINITGNKIQIGLGDSYVAEGGFDVYVTEDGSGNYITE